MPELFNGYSQYLPDLSSFILTFAEGAICMLLLTFAYRRRKLYILRLLATILVGIVLCFIFTLWKSSYDDQTSAQAIVCRITTYTLINLYLLTILFFCYRENSTENLLCWSLSVSINSLAMISYSVILNICGIDDKTSISFFETSNIVRDYAILLSYHFVIYLIFAFLFLRRNKIQQNRTTSLSVAITAFATVMFAYVLGSISRVFEYTSYEMTIITKLFKLICSGFVIYLSLGIIQRNKLSQDLEITEQLLKQEKKQYEISKSTVEIINMKCHDLKHRLDSFEHKLNEEEMKSLKEAIEIYDSNIKTGNDILDVVMYEKQLLCNRENITLSCMADGTLLAHISPSHLYSLIGNAINNAIEAVKQIDDTEKKLISITVTRQDDNALIEISNFFTGKRLVEDGNLRTTKADFNKHGYGIKSMKYITEIYGGKFSLSTVDDIFTLTITLPVINKS